MQKKIAEIKEEIKGHKLICFVLLIVVILSFYLRIHGVSTVLGFYFDQGRDALVIWDLIHFHKFFLIGPTTGLPGIFRGPYYYYLIAPFYFLGRGNPTWPSIFLSFTTVLGVVLIYHLGSKMADRTTGIIAAIIAGFSFNIVIASRWLSNPTPMLILSMILVWAMLSALDGKKWAWPVIATTYGLSLFSFGSSGEFFYTFSILVFFIWMLIKQGFGKKNSSLNMNNLIISGVLFFLTFAPLVFFDLKHGHILLHNFMGTFGAGGGSFKIPTSDFFNSRNASYFDIFTNKIFQDRKNPEIVILAIIAISFLICLPRIVKNNKIKVVLLLLISPVIGLYFYQGNYGVLYDYYMTGYYLIFVLLFAIVLGMIWKFNIVGKLFIFYFFYLFFTNNVPVTLSKINDGCDGPTSICFINQKRAIDWIYSDAKDSRFNVDVYVPPVIPYAYTYLLEWKANPNLDTNQVPLLYTLYEIDPPHPERLDAWLARQKGIGKVLDTESFGGITVQKRERIPQKNK